MLVCLDVRSGHGPSDHSRAITTIQPDVTRRREILTHIPCPAKARMIDGKAMAEKVLSQVHDAVLQMGPSPSLAQAHTLTLTN